MPLSDTLRDFFYARDLTDATKTFYVFRLTPFFQWLQEMGVTDTDQLAKEHLRAYFAHRREAGTSQGTLYADRGAVRAWLKFCVSEELCDPRLIPALPQAKKTQKVLEVFSDDQLNALFAAANKPPQGLRDVAICAVLLDTGMRVHELCGLTMDRTIMRQDDAYLKLEGKGRKEREVGLGRQSRLALNRYIQRERPKGTDWTFVGRRGNQMTNDAVQKLLWRLERQSGIAGVRCSPHTFRHTFAVKYLGNGGDVYKLSRLLGHSSISTTEVYLRAFKALDARVGASVLDVMRR